MIRLTTLGSVRVYRDAREVPDLPAQRLRCALLIYLATERDVSRADAVTMFWPERDTGRGKHALRQMLYELRGVLGDDGLELRRDRIRCSAWIDAADFERAATEGRAADALELYAGPFLHGFSLENGAFEGWVERRRAHYGRLYRRLQRDHIDALNDTGDREGALASARRWVELDPLDDEAAHTFIRQLALAGRRTEALQHFDSYEKQLLAELDVQPLDDTLALVAGIRSGTESGVGALDPFPARETTVSAATRTAPAEPAASSTPRPGRRRALLRHVRSRRVAAALLILVASAAVAVFGLSRDDRPAAPSRTLRIAVLPVTDQTTDGSLTGVAGELTEQLTSALGQSRVLEIVAARDVELAGGVRISADSVARQAGADYLVGGSISRDEDRLRLQLVLRDGRSGAVVGNQLVERIWGQAQNLVDDVVASAATVLRTELGTALELRRVRATARSQRSWQLVLEGKELVSQTVTLVRAGQADAALRALNRADSTFTLAQSIDPRWPEPLVQRAWLRHRRALLLRHFAGGSPDEIEGCVLEAVRLAEDAIALDPRDVAAHEVRGVLLLQRASEALPADTVRRLNLAAEQSLQRAVDIEPQRQTALRYLAELLHSTERYGEARLAAAEALRADPHANANVLLNLLFQSAFEAWEDDLADSWCMTGRYRFNDQAPFTWCLLAQHAWGSTTPDPPRLRRALAAAPPIMFRFQPDLADKFEAMLAAAFARANQPDSALAILHRLDRSSDDGLTWLRAAAYVQLGDEDTALGLLRTLPPSLTNLRVMRQRAFWDLRGNPEFQRMIQRPPS